MDILGLGDVLGPNVKVKLSGEMLFIHDSGEVTRALFNPQTGVILEFDSVERSLPDVTDDEVTA